MKTRLGQYPWESMRSPEEIREDENRQRHLGGECEGAPWCWWCQQYIEDEKARQESTRNGVHDHFCPKCGREFICPKVTHCREPLETLCPDHKAKACADAFKPLLWAVDRLFSKPTVKVLHVTEPIGGKRCPKCGNEGEKRGSWEHGPFYYECDDCGHQWGHV